MDLSKLPGCSPDIYLSDISLDIKAAESDVPREEQAVVTINYANEGDRIERESLTERRETHVLPDKVIEVSIDNARERMELVCYLTRNSVRNLKSAGREVFEAIPVNNLGRNRFSQIWRSLPPMVTDAIHSAVRLHNPEWNWEG